MIMTEIMRWGCLWHAKNKLNGVTEHLICEKEAPVLFRTRREARAYIKLRFGYIYRRDDLRREPHGWRMPKAIRVTISPSHDFEIRKLK